MSVVHNRSYSYSPAHRLLEIAAISALFLMVFVGTWRILSIKTQPILSLVFGALLVGYILADFASGFVHWACDRFGTETTPILGPNFIKPFRHHHVDPKAITQHDFIETNGNNSIVTLPMMGLAWVIPVDVSWGIFAFTCFTSLAFWIFLTNQFHKWSHQKRDQVPWVIKQLQKSKIVMSVEHHRVHHTAPHDAYYCITSGWLNRPLDAIGFWTKAEFLIERIFDIRPYQDPIYIESAQASSDSTSHN
jgi:ubiquitin-conjugating enzyme E2 variant